MDERTPAAPEGFRRGGDRIPSRTAPSTLFRLLSVVGPAYLDRGGGALIKTSELRSKDVINLVDGRRLGFVGDLDLDLEGGQIQSFVIQSTNRLLGLFGKDRDTVVLWSQVEKIGEDVILVRIDNYSEATVR